MQSTAVHAPPDLTGLDGAALLEHAGRVVEALASTALGGAVDDDTLNASVRRLAALESAVHAEKLRRIAEVSDRESFRAEAERSAADWVAAATGVSASRARSEAATAAALRRMPQTAAKLAAGELTPEHAATAARGLAVLDKHREQRERDAGADEDAWKDAVADGANAAAALDDLVAGKAGETDARGLHRDIEAWTQANAADAVADRNARAARRRGHWWADQRDADGLWRYWGRATDADRAQMGAGMGPLARKTSTDDGRLAAQRDLDALVEVCRRACDAGHLPAVAAQRPHVITVRHQNGAGEDIAAPWVDGVGPVGSATAALFSCDADTTTFTVTPDGRWDVGRSNGDPSSAQRKAVIARDLACVGCGADASRCQLHHIVFRSNDGPTTVSNLVLVCWSCHHGLHHLGWTVDRDADGRQRIRKRRAG